MRKSLFKQMEQRIETFAPGAVVSIADFTDIAKPKTVSKMLQRLADDGRVEKVLRSVFWKPDREYTEPDPHEVAKALARENGWELVPTKETALHLFGMVDASPRIWTYATNGTYRNYRYGGTRIAFTHTGRTHWAKWSEKTALFVESLRAYGKNRMTKELLARFSEKIRGWDLTKLAEDTKSVATWIRETTKGLCRAAGGSADQNH